METGEKLIRELRDVAESPLSSKADILRIVEKLERLPGYRGTVRNDPMKEAIVEILAACTHDADRLVYYYGQPVTAAVLCEALHRNADIVTLTRIGKIVAELGYQRMQRTRTRGSVYRAPRPLDE